MNSYLNSVSDQSGIDYIPENKVCQKIWSIQINQNRKTGWNKKSIPLQSYLRFDK